MTVNLATFVGLYDKQLTTLGHLLDKGAAFAAEQGVSEEDMLDWRLITDMQPLSFQAAVVINFAVQWPARTAGLAEPMDVGMGVGLDVAGFKAAIAEARAWIADLPADPYAGREDLPLTYTIGTGMTPTLPNAQWITGFATTNLYFHLSMAYAILRAKGVAIGKADLFAGGL